MIASERRPVVVTTSSSPGAVAVAVGNNNNAANNNGGVPGGIGQPHQQLIQQRGSSSSTLSTLSSSSGVNRILNSGRPVKIYVIDPRKFQERLEKYVGGLQQQKDVPTLKGGKKSTGAGGGVESEIKKIDKRNNNINNNNNYSYSTNIIVDLTDDDVIIEEERLVSRNHGNVNNNNNVSLVSNKNGLSNSLPVIAPAAPTTTLTFGNGTEKDHLTSAIQNDSNPNGKQQNLGGGSAMSVVNTSNPNATSNSTNPKKKKSTKKKPTKKKKASGTSGSSSSNVRRGSKSEDKLEAELAFLRKETTTRTGRVSKSPGAAAAAAAALAVNGALGSLNNIIIGGGVHQGHQGTTTTSQPSSPSGSLFICSDPNSRVPSPSPSLGGGGGIIQQQVIPTTAEVVVPVKKKRVPPEMFRCITCNKFYVGFAKFNAHFAKFPDHVKSNATKKGMKKKNKTDEEARNTEIQATATSTELTSEIMETNQQPNLQQSSQSIFTCSNGHVQIQNPLSTNNTISNGSGVHQNLSSFSVEQGISSNTFQLHSIAQQCNSANDLNSSGILLNTTSSTTSDNINIITAHQIQLSTVVSSSSTICPQESISTPISNNIINLNPIHSSEILPSTPSPRIVTAPTTNATASVTSVFSSGYPFVNQTTQQEQQTSFLHSSNSLPSPLQLSSSLINVNEDTMISGSGGGGRDDFFMMDFNPHISEISQLPGEFLGQGSCSQQSFNSLENLLADSNSQSQSAIRLISPNPLLLLEGANEENANGPRLLLNMMGSSSRNDLMNSTGCNRSTFFSLNGGEMEEDQDEIRNLEGRTVRNSVDNNIHNNNNSSYSQDNVSNTNDNNSNDKNNTAVSIGLPVDEEESRDLCININLGGVGTRGNNESESGGCEIMSVDHQTNSCDIGMGNSHLDGHNQHLHIQHHLSQGQNGSNNNGSIQRRKSIWEFVKEQIRLCGINQACGEISEMAEKLSKVARDKFYPIREEEIERMNGSPPIIQVETPFISHLLDLPFGTYIYKEDGGVRKVVPPPTPISSEISLTNGVEVDVDKFLSPDFDLISLPHLTNLDFTSICNNNDDN